MTCSKIKLTCFLVGCGGFAQTSTLNKDSLKLCYSTDISWSHPLSVEARDREPQEELTTAATSPRDMSDRPLGRLGSSHWPGKSWCSSSGKPGQRLAERPQIRMEFLSKLWWLVMQFNTVETWENSVKQRYLQLFKTKFKMWVPWG